MFPGCALRPDGPGKCFWGVVGGAPPDCGVEVDRKILAEIAVSDAPAFAAIAATAKGALED